MKRMTPKLTGAFVALLLFAAAVTTASAQTQDEFAAKGYAIANVDRVVAAARLTEWDGSYWLGFDIATGIFGDPMLGLGFDIASGIFGDPALGANGNTATGPGSLKIRDSLSAAGQRGFNASVKLHLSRNYKP